MRFVDPTWLKSSLSEVWKGGSRSSVIIAAPVTTYSAPGAVPGATLMSVAGSGLGVACTRCILSS